MFFGMTEGGKEAFFMLRKRGTSFVLFEVTLREVASGVSISHPLPDTSGLNTEEANQKIKKLAPRVVIIEDGRAIIDGNNFIPYCPTSLLEYK